MSQGMHAALESQREGRNGFYPERTQICLDFRLLTSTTLIQRNLSCFIPLCSSLSRLSEKHLYETTKKSKPRLNIPNTMKKEVFDSHFERLLSFMAPWSSSCNCAAQESALQEEPRTRSNSRDCSDLIHLGPTSSLSPPANNGSIL